MHCRRQKAAHGVRGRDRERNERGAPVVRAEKTGHAQSGARQCVPREHIANPVKSLTAGLPLDLEFRTKGQLATDICAEATADGVTCDFYCGDEVYGNCTELREYFETSDQAYVLRVLSKFRITLRSGIVVTCAEAVATLLQHTGRWEIRSAARDPRETAGTHGPGSGPPRRGTTC